MNHVLKLLVL